MKSHSHSPLDSSTAHRQSAVLGWALKGILVLLLSYAIGWVLEQYQWATYQFPQTVLWCSVPYTITAYWLYNGAYLPQFEERRFLLVATAAPYLAAPLCFALLQQPYSRGAVLLVYLLSAAWFTLGHWRERGRYALSLAYLDSSVPMRLKELLGDASEFSQQDIKLQPLAIPAASDAAPQVTDDTSFLAGVVIDPQAPTDAVRERLISDLRLQHVRLYSVEAVAELISGRKMLSNLQANVGQALDGVVCRIAVQRP